MKLSVHLLLRAVKTGLFLPVERFPTLGVSEKPAGGRTVKQTETVFTVGCHLRYRYILTSCISNCGVNIVWLIGRQYLTQGSCWPFPGFTPGFYAFTYA